LQAPEVAQHQSRRGIEIGPQLKNLGVRQRLDDVDRGLHDLVELHGTQVQANLALDDTAHVQEVFDELHLSLAVALDRIQALRDLFGLDVAGAFRLRPLAFLDLSRELFVEQGQVFPGTPAVFGGPSGNSRGTRRG
jgi:hypothetical protein